MIHSDPMSDGVAENPPPESTGPHVARPATAIPKLARNAFLLAGVTALLLVGGLVMPVGETTAQDPVIIALDVDTSGNQATSVGNIDDCLSVDAGATLDVDIIIKNVENLFGWESPFVYDKSILEVTAVDVELFQAADGSTDIVNASASVPDRDGVFFVAAVDNPNAVDSGSGVLARLTLKAVGTGTSPARLEHDFDNDGTPDLRPTLTSLRFDTTSHPGDDDGDQMYDGPIAEARIAVDVPCRTESTPTPTPIPTPTPPPPLSDADGDGVPDVDDQCPDTPAGDSVDASGCSLQQEGDMEAETRDQLLQGVAVGLSLDVTLDTVTVGGSTIVLAVFADQNEEPVSGLDVIFNIEQQPGSDADLEGEAETTRTSDAEGVAEAKLNVGNTPGEIIVSATAGDQTETVTVSVVEAAAGDNTPQGEKTPGAEETPGPGDASPDGTAGAGPVTVEPGGGAAGSGDGGSLPAWIIGLIAAGVLALAAGAFAAWQAARQRAS